MLSNHEFSNRGRLVATTIILVGAFGAERILPNFHSVRAAESPSPTPGYVVPDSFMTKHSFEDVTATPTPTPNELQHGVIATIDTRALFPRLTIGEHTPVIPATVAPTKTATQQEPTATNTPSEVPITATPSESPTPTATVAEPSPTATQEAPKPIETLVLAPESKVMIIDPDNPDTQVPTIRSMYRKANDWTHGVAVRISHSVNNKFFKVNLDGQEANVFKLEQQQIPENQQPENIEVQPDSYQRKMDTIDMTSLPDGSIGKQFYELAITAGPDENVELDVIGDVTVPRTGQNPKYPPDARITMPLGNHHVAEIGFDYNRTVFYVYATGGDRTEVFKKQISTGTDTKLGYAIRLIKGKSEQGTTDQVHIYAIPDQDPDFKITDLISSLAGYTLPVTTVDSLVYIPTFSADYGANMQIRAQMQIPEPQTADSPDDLRYEQQVDSGLLTEKSIGVMTGISMKLALINPDFASADGQNGADFIWGGDDLLPRQVIQGKTTKTTLTMLEHNLHKAEELARKTKKPLPLIVGLDSNTTGLGEETSISAYRAYHEMLLRIRPLTDQAVALATNGTVHAGARAIYGGRTDAETIANAYVFWQGQNQDNIWQGQPRQVDITGDRTDRIEQRVALLDQLAKLGFKPQRDYLGYDENAPEMTDAAIIQLGQRNIQPVFLGVRQTDPDSAANTIKKCKTNNCGVMLADGVPGNNYAFLISPDTRAPYQGIYNKVDIYGNAIAGTPMDNLQRGLSYPGYIPATSINKYLLDLLHISEN